MREIFSTLVVVAVTAIIIVVLAVAIVGGVSALGYGLYSYFGG